MTQTDNPTIFGKIIPESDVSSSAIGVVNLAMAAATDFCDQLTMAMPLPGETQMQVLDKIMIIAMAKALFVYLAMNY